MKLAIALTLLFAAATPAMAQYCPYGQTCQNPNPVPFPVINPLLGLNNLLPQKNNQPPPPPAAYAPVATPPPVLPPPR
ncbi:MAG: hypothetical protein ABI608_02585 [Rhizomicrobium sp.]